MRTLFQRMSNLLLILLGVAATAFVVASTVGLTGLLDDRTVIVSTFGLIGAIAIAWGIDRETLLRGIQSDLQDTMTMIHSQMGGIFLSGEQRVYRFTLPIALQAEEEIVSMLIGTQPRAPSWWANAVIEHLEDSSKRGSPIVWNVYLAFPSDAQPDWSPHMERAAVLKERGVDTQVHFWHVPYEERWGFDFLIIDKRHVTVTMPSQLGSDAPHRAMVFMDVPELASGLLQWVSHLDIERLKLDS